jgi:multidrug efflux pump
MRVALGVAVFSGMLGVTIFGIFFTPVFYAVVRWFTERKSAVPVLAHDADLKSAVTKSDGQAADDPKHSFPDKQEGIRRERMDEP